MSAYAEWKAGMITDAEYAGICREEEWEMNHPDDDDDEEVFEDDEFVDEF